MILDNENNNLKVHEWISKYTENGKLDLVTGYFTIGALAWLSNQVNDNISEFRLVLGDIVNLDMEEEHPLDLLNENITIEAALKLNSLSQEAVKFLRQDKVLAKTLEPNFCHAKSYIFQPYNKDDRDKYFISGSSNITEAGLGLKQTKNLELNIAETGNNNQFKELIEWFEDLWSRPQAHKEKTIIGVDGTKSKVDFKEYLIKEIEKIFIKYTPKEIYYKILFELFGSQILESENDPEFNRQFGRLENSIVYNTLYEFQKKGVLSLIKMLQKYDGAILADAVGLGKTWSALAVIKFFQLQGREVLLLCPKKLENNWLRYRKHQNSRFEKDQFDFFVRFHSDLSDERLNKYNDRADKNFVNDKPKLIVIDESHNLRNDKSNRYNTLLKNIISQNDDIKVLLLSATPINNSLNDIRNQFKLIAKGNVHGYDKNLGVKNLDYTFRSAQKSFNEWRLDLNPKINDFVKKLPDNFFTLTDSLIVARTRKMVEGEHDKLNFPLKSKPLNLFVTPKQLGNFETFEELFEHFPPMLSGYQPSFYLADIKNKNTDVLYDEKQRDHFLVKMLYILMVKRLESSWSSFYSTVKKIKDHHQNTLDKIKQYQEKHNNSILDASPFKILDDFEIEDDFDELALGKNRQIKISEIDHAGKLDQFKKDLKKDLDALDNLFINLQKFENKIKKEILVPNNLESEDDKLKILMQQIVKKRSSNENFHNQKIIIFTVYRETAQYLFNQLKDRGFGKIAMVSGSGSMTEDSDEELKNFEPILERFAPYTKLFMEKEWSFNSEENGRNAYLEWIQWISQNDKNTYNKILHPIDILIATDALSEGQNLQDADMVINYDIHWNPVRIIQRMGRIDRLGSPNEKIFGINFWPSNNINTYLNLQGRIEQRMATMKLAGAEVDHQFSDSFAQIIQDESLDQRMRNRMLEQMQITFDDLDGEKSFGFNDLSLENFRQELLEEFLRDKAKYKKMPKGIYSGFKADKNICPKDGIIALLGYPSKLSKTDVNPYSLFDLIYIDKKGKLVALNHKEVLDILTKNKDKDRYVPDLVDKGDEDAISELVEAINNWLADQKNDFEQMENGNLRKSMGKEAKDLLSKLRKGNHEAVMRIKENTTVENKFQLDKFDLITWFLVTT